VACSWNDRCELSEFWFFKLDQSVWNTRMSITSGHWIVAYIVDHKHCWSTASLNFESNVFDLLYSINVDQRCTVYIVAWFDPLRANIINRSLSASVALLLLEDTWHWASPIRLLTEDKHFKSVDNKQKAFGAHKEEVLALHTSRNGSIVRSHICSQTFGFLLSAQMVTRRKFSSNQLQRSWKMWLVFF
jgi:hypothetical protein